MTKYFSIKPFSFNALIPLRCLSLISEDDLISIANLFPMTKSTSKLDVDLQ